MTSVCTRNLDCELTAVSARLMEIINTQYKLKLPKYTDAEENIARGISKIASNISYKRRSGDLDKIDKDWIELFSLDQICIWAMSGKYDVFADLLDELKLGRCTETPFHRGCSRGVSLEDVERRKALLAEALDAYAAEIRAQKMKRERGR